MTRPCLALDPSGRQVAFPLQHVRGALAVLTRCRVALETVRGSWPDDVRFGLPILEWVETPGLADIEVESVVRLMLEQVDGVVSVVDVTASREDEDLHIRAHLKVRDDDGAVVEAEVGEPFDEDLRGPAVWLMLLSPVKTRPGRTLGVRGGMFAVAQVAPLPTFPANAYGHWDPVQAPGVFDATNYFSVPDGSGNTRPWSVPGSPDPGVTSTAYPVRGGTQVLPQIFSTTSYLEYDAGSPIGFANTTLTLDLGFGMIAWGHHDQALANGAGLGPVIRIGAGSAFKVRWDVSTAPAGTVRLAGAGVGTEVPGCPTPVFPQRGGVGAAGSTSAWWAWSVVRGGTGTTSIWYWTLVGDMDDGLGVRVFVDTVVTESTTKTLTSPGGFQHNLANAPAVRCQEGPFAGKEAGGCAAYASAPDPAQARAALAAAANLFSTAAAQSVRGLLGV